VLWLGCPSKACCFAPVVIPTGTDIWRIARALDAPPSSFLMYFETTVPRRDGFALDRSGRRFRLALAKNPELERDGRMGCIFLLRTRTGEHRCGLGDRRPMGCRVFPCEISGGEVAIQSDHGCVCRQWSLADIDTVAERPLLEARQAESETYCDVVAGWNAWVATLPDRQGKRFDQYCEYLLEVYDQMEESTLADVVES
jgi:Fe-S-cluster containining protein